MLALHFPDGSQLAVNVGDMHVVGRGQRGLDDLEVSQSQFAVSCASQDSGGGLRVNSLGLNRASSLLKSNPFWSKNLIGMLKSPSWSAALVVEQCQSPEDGTWQAIHLLDVGHVRRPAAHTLAEPCLLAV